MRYHSTNDMKLGTTLEGAVLSSYAPDHGLYLPDRIPTLPRAFFSNLGSMTLQEVSYAVANFALQGDIDAEVLHDIIFDTLNFPIPLSYIDGAKYVLELFHGPTMSFKDIGARFMARLMGHFTKKHHKSINVLVTTSGNSGGAIANGFYDIPGVHVWVLFPQNHLNVLQDVQFTTLGHNVTAIEVNGTREDCRNLADQAFADEELVAQLGLTSAKSINMARLLPQMFYYFWTFAQLEQRGQDVSNVVFSVPCGNLGNLTAGVMAQRMGLPIKRFIAADNRNDVFTHYLKTGDWTTRTSEPSVAPAIDMGSPRNFVRLKELMRSHMEMCQIMEGRAYSDEQITRAIAETWKNENYLLDPHSAVAYQAMCDALRPGETGIALGTAHPAKSMDTVATAIGQSIDVPDTLKRRLFSTRQVVPINSGYNALRNFLLKQSQRL